MFLFIKKIYVISLLIPAPFLSYCQVDSLDQFSDTTRKGYRPFEVFLGKKVFAENFYGQFNTIENFNLSTPVTILGIGVNGQFNVNRSLTYFGHLAILFILPEKITVDTIGSGKITGYIFSFSCAGIDVFRKSKFVKLFAYIGLNTGKIRIINNPIARQRNLFLAPMVAICPKLILKPITIAVNIQYDQDITNPKWKRAWFAEHKKFDLGKFRQSGLTTLLCVGLELE